MKLLALFLLLSGVAQAGEFQFKANERVLFSPEHFFGGCYGIMRNFHRTNDGYVVYSLSVFCNGTMARYMYDSDGSELRKKP